MKAALTIIMLTLCTTAGAQLPARLSGLFNELHSKLQYPLRRGYYYSNRFAADSTGQLKPAYTTNLSSETDLQVLSILDAYRNLFRKDSTYFLSVYWDHYTENVYSSIFEEPVDRQGGFPNYDNYDAVPPQGYHALARSIANDLKRNHHRINVSAVNWHSPIEIYIDTAGKAEFLRTNTLVDFLDSTRTLAWHPTFHYGRKHGSILSFDIDKASILSAEPKTRIRPKLQYALSEKFNGKLVRVREHQNDFKLPPGALVVSFVLKPDAGFEQPLAHQGDPEEAKRFIKWLQELKLDPSSFYWKPFPRANRYYFYLM